MERFKGLRFSENALMSHLVTDLLSQTASYQPLSDILLLAFVLCIMSYSNTPLISDWAR